MKQVNYEDIIMKRAMDLFAEEGLKFFGINKNVKELGPTELVVLESKNMFMDYTFLMEDDTFIHFEFQTTNKGILDLRRFRAYEALLSYQTSKPVITYVVYSGDISNPLSGYEEGINTYRINAISMINKDGDKIFNEIVDKIKLGENLTKHDIIALTFTPIMGGTISKADKILNAIRIVKNIDKEYRHDIESILYAFANKFLDSKDLERVKEEIRMTELGRSLIEEGKEEGLKEGAKRKAIEIAKELLDILSEEVVAKKTGLTLNEVKEIKANIYKAR
jgi:predicted transposase/invertase (TIGR01784 family)